MLRPLTNIDDAGALAVLGREYALMNHRRDALAQLRDCVTMLNNEHADHGKAIRDAREAIDRLEELNMLQA